MDKLNLWPAVAYLMACAIAWGLGESNSIIALLGYFLLFLTTFNISILIDFLRELDDPLVGVTDYWGILLNTNQELLLFQLFNLLIIFSLTNDYTSVKPNLKLLLRRCIPFFLIGGFFLYSDFTNYVLNAERHAKSAKESAKIIRADARKIYTLIKESNGFSEEEIINCYNQICNKTYSSPYYKISLDKNGEFKVKITKTKIIQTGHSGPFFHSTNYTVKYDSKSDKSNYDVRTNHAWWIICFAIRAIFFLAIMLFPFTALGIKKAFWVLGKK